MIYDSKEQAEKAAEEFAMDKLRDCFLVQIYGRDNSTNVRFGPSDNGPWHYETFKYRTLNKGDICWVWDGAQDKGLRIFNGNYACGKPMFSYYKNFDDSFTWNHYEQTGLNIFDGGNNDER